MASMGSGPELQLLNSFFCFVFFPSAEPPFKPPSTRPRNAGGDPTCVHQNTRSTIAKIYVNGAQCSSCVGCPPPLRHHKTPRRYFYTCGRVSVFCYAERFWSCVLSKQKRRRNVSRRAEPTVQLASCQDGLPTRMRPAVSTSGLACVKCVTGGICIIFGKQRKIPHKAAYCSEFVFLPSLSHD